MGRITDTLLAEERAEWDALMTRLPPAEVALVRLLEIFVTHQLNQAAMLNEEIRGMLARQAVDLANHEQRLRRIEARQDMAEQQRGELLRRLDQLQAQVARITEGDPRD